MPLWEFYKEILVMGVQQYANKNYLKGEKGFYAVHIYRFHSRIV